jgi:hypothetical protein
MRTTLTLDARIAQVLKEIAHRSDRPFEEVVNETLRAGLTAQGERRARRYRARPASLGGPLPGIDLDEALALADAIENQELAARMWLRR